MTCNSLTTSRRKKPEVEEPANWHVDENEIAPGPPMEEDPTAKDQAGYVPGQGSPPPYLY